jgi:hypothetical protein
LNRTFISPAALAVVTGSTGDINIKLEKSTPPFVKGQRILKIGWVGVLDGLHPTWSAGNQGRTQTAILQYLYETFVGENVIILFHVAVASGGGIARRYHRRYDMRWVLTQLTHTYSVGPRGEDDPLDRMENAAVVALMPIVYDRAYYENSPLLLDDHLYNLSWELIYEGQRDVTEASSLRYEAYTVR